MENASKALIIAGSILIAIMIISLGIYIFKQYSSFAKENADLSEQEISAFNSKITSYLGKGISGSQVNALLQYCLANNMSAQQSGETYKCITVTQKTNNDELVGKNSDKYKKVETGKFYTVEGKSGDNGLITSITVQ